MGHRFLNEWSKCGILTPLYGALIWSVASGNAIIFSSIFSAPLYKYLGSISFQIYILQVFAGRVTFLLFDDWWEELYIPLLIVISAVSYHIIEGPVGDLCLAVIRTCTGKRSITLPFSKERAAGELEPKMDFFYLSSLVAKVLDMPVFFKLMLYYLSMSAIIVLYICTLTLSWEGSSTLVRLNRNSNYGALFESMKWLVLIGLPATACTMIGQCGWFPWNRGPSSWGRKVVPPMDELQNRFKNKMYFRIVTRGSHPMLVRDNALAALQVLDSCLSRDCYVLEVVTDNSIDAFPYLLEHFVPGDNKETFSLKQNFREIVVESSFICSSGE